MYVVQISFVMFFLCRYGAVDGFLTPNVADARNPLVVVLHNGCVAASAGGLTPEGKSEKFTVNLLSEEPDMPSAGRMLEILAEILSRKPSSSSSACDCS